MSETDEQASLELGESRYEAWELSPEGIADNNRRMIERQQFYRRAADVATKALIPFKEVQAVAVLGSVAVPLWKDEAGNPQWRAVVFVQRDLCPDCRWPTDAQLEGAASAAGRRKSLR